MFSSLQSPQEASLGMALWVMVKHCQEGILFLAASTVSLDLFKEEENQHNKELKG